MNLRRIHRGEHLTDGTVLPRRVATLQDDEQRVARVRVQQALQVADALDLFLARAL
jgi:hypothetical protein